MRLRSALLSIVVIAGGVVGAQTLIASAPQPERTQTEATRTPVRAIAVERAHARVTVTGMGTVVPARQVDLYAEVTGRVTAQFDGLREGAHVARGTRLIRVDSRDYKYAVDTARASLAQARARLEEERNRKEVAERDWALLEKSLGSIDVGITPSAGDPTDPTDPATPATPATPTAGSDSDEPTFNPGDVARRVPQIQSAEANLRSVRSQLKQAELQVGRTKLIAPFDAVVTRKTVETGQLVGPTTSLATLVGTRQFHVKVAVPVGSLSSIAIPGTNTTQPIGARVRVVQQAGDEVVEREGHVVRLLGELEQDGRMAQLVVAVDDPFQLRLPPEQRALPLLLGSYVRVEIEGAELQDVIEIPRAALREGDTVWLIDSDDELELRKITITWRSRDSVFIDKGLTNGERVITSRLAVPLVNMPLRVVDDDSTTAGAPPTTEVPESSASSASQLPPPTPSTDPHVESKAGPDKAESKKTESKKTKSKKTKSKKTKPNKAEAAGTGAP
ncbi:MAG: efflux RND transporter periplasmic adaptor subunit [Myxococcota bacterium]